MTKSKGLFLILLVALVPCIPASATIINATPVTCSAVERVLADVKSFPHPDRWQVIVVCDAALWLKLKAEYSVTGRTDYAFTLRSLHISFINPAAYDWVPGSTMRFVLAHEAGHIMCACDDEAQADKEAMKMLK